MQLMAADTGDKGWLLLAAKMVMQGRHLYRDVVEVNPPLILWLYTIPVMLSAHFASDANWLAILGLAAVALSVALCNRLLARHPALDRAAISGFGLLLALLFVAFTPPNYFFDREHMLLVLTLPYLLRFMPEIAPQKLPLRLRLLISLLAAVGFCIKPYTLILFACVQLIVMLRERSVRILFCLENAVIYAAAALYLCCIWHFTPEYITQVLPMALVTYGAFSRRLIGIFYLIYAFITAGLIFADFRLRDRSPYRSDILYLTIISAAWLIYALAGNGWGYTYHPLICMLLFVNGWVWLQQRTLAQEQTGQKRFTFGARALARSTSLLGLGYALYCIIGFYTTPLCDWSPDLQSQPALCGFYMQDTLHIHSFGALSEDFHKWASLARLTGASFDTRYNALWMVPQFVISDASFTGGRTGVLSRKSGARSVRI